ncbi:MAG: hypothetical protein Fues2KO_28890 [Fuerstiella sp.]
MARASIKKGKQTIRQRMLRWMLSPLRLAIVGGLITAWVCWPAVEQQIPKLDNRPEYVVGVDQIVVTPPPRWVPEDVVAKVFERAGFEQPLSLLDPRVSEKVALAFYRYPWIERLKRVRKSFPAQVYVEVVYRTPAAMVEVSGGGYLPVDRHGHLLPEQDFSVADIDRYPLIRGITTAPIGRHGEAWGDPAVSGAAELAAVLTEENESHQSWWNSLGLKAIVAPATLAATETAENLHFELVTRGGSEILWGRPPATRHPGEVTVATKLKRMAEFHQRFNGFDSGPAPVRIDIRDWDRIRSSVIARKNERSERN